MDENNNVVELQESRGKKFLRKTKEIGGKIIQVVVPVLTVANTVFLTLCCVSAAKDVKTDFSKPNNESMEVKPATKIEPSVE